ncbi:MAG: YidC/Oxa1 family membrane protein insertase, partial [Candidatus Heimdallarchaeota archaeon]|nr:YidC/Oxa1 family membrane protein insertase [Candidatus Heimdallarchaeota archaeon]
DDSKKTNDDNVNKTKDNDAETIDDNETTKTDENNTVKKDDSEQTEPEIEEAKYPWQMKKPQKTLKESYIKSEKYDTDVMEIAFSSRGGTIAEIWLKGFPGGGKNHMDIPENEKNRLQYVRPYNPNKLTGALDFSSEDYELKTGLTINAEWEFVGHETTYEIISKPTMSDLTQDYENNEDLEVETDETRVTHEITFAYPPRNAKGEVPFRVFKTFKYSDKEYMINIDIKIVNYTENLLDIDEFVLWGPVGLFTGYGNRISDYAIWKIGTTTDATWESTSKLKSSYDKLNKDKRKLRNFTTNVLATSNMTGGRLTFLGSFNGQFEAVMMDPRIFSKDVHVEGGIVEMFQIAGNADPEFPKRILPSYGFVFNKIRLKKGETLNISTPMFIGPKKEDFIPQALEETMLYSFEWINWLGKIMFKIMKFFHGIVVNMGIGGAWGIAIILLTILVRICLMPLSYKAQSAMQESQANMKKIQPKITKIKQKYGAGKKQLTREQKMKMNQ